MPYRVVPNIRYALGSAATRRDPGCLGQQICREVAAGISRRARGAKRYLIAFAALVPITLAAVAFFARGSSLEEARDYEECVEAIMANQSSPASGDEHSSAMTGCNARFAGRRKPGGGYSYYDFRQGRSFDIAGPNPTAEERKQIDHE
jgi:hypothetical protein